MASTGSRSERQALGFDPKYIRFKRKGQMLLLILAPSSSKLKYQRLIRSTTQVIQAVPTGKSDFGAPNDLMRVLRYYHRSLSEHPELRKGRRHFFIPIKDNNAGKGLSAATVFRWICITIVDSHAALQNSKSIPGRVKAHEFRGYLFTTL